MGKPFLTIDQQVALLESRGVSTDGSTGPVLLREGYYSIVNGYKDPFIDSEKTTLAKDDRFIEGTSFSAIYDLFAFDRELRGITFRYLIKAEAAARTAIAYCFSEAHSDPNDYLSVSNFCTEEEYKRMGNNPSRYSQEIAGLINVLSARASNSRTGFIEHYRNAYGAVPLWVLANDLTFGNLEHFYNLMKPSEQRAFCKALAKSTGRLGGSRLGHFDVADARVSLEVLVKFRNICAHDERLYCARVGGRKAISYGKMVWKLERFLTDEDFHSFLTEFLSLIDGSFGHDRAFAHVLRESGFPDIASEMRKRQDQLTGDASTA